MKKLIVALAVAAMTAGAGIQAQVCANAQNCPRAQQCPQQCDSACMTPCPRQQCAFDNLNLTDAQKQKLKALCEKQQQNKKAAKADRKAAKKARLEEIKGILTPEQYVMFLENHFINGSGNKFVKRAGRPERGAKHMKKAALRGECATECPNVPVRMQIRR